MKKHLLLLVTAAFASLFIGLTGCNGGSTNTAGTGGATSVDGTSGNGGTNGTDGVDSTDGSVDDTLSAQPESDGIGKLKVLLTDDPATYLAVYVTIDEIQVKRHDGNLTDSNESNGSADNGQSPWITVAHPLKTYDLLTLRNGVTAELGDTNVSVGSYTHLRLILGEQEDNGTNILGREHPFANYIVFVGDDFAELQVPSNRLEQHFDFDVNETGVIEMTIDFDANRSIHQAGRSGKWILTPVLGISSKHLSEGERAASGTDETGGDDDAVEQDDDDDVGQDDNGTGGDAVGQDDDDGEDDDGVDQNDDDGSDDDAVGEDGNETGSDDGVGQDDDGTEPDDGDDEGDGNADTNATDGNATL